MSTISSAPDHTTTERISQDQLDALVRLHVRYLEGRIGGRRATLKNTDLSGLNLANQDLRQADFTGCIMNRMNLSGTNFQEASLYACDLTNANLSKAIFVRSDLRGARIENANLKEADLEAADLRVGAVSVDGLYHKGDSVNFRGANLSGAKLVGSLAGSADFSDAILAGANIARADLRGAKFEGADLSDADMDGVKLEGANLKAAIMTGVKANAEARLIINASDALTDENVGDSISNLSESLHKLIETHRMWVSTSGGQGRRLDLSGYDMRELKSLKQEKLTAIKACNAQFFGMNLYKIEMQSAQLDGADFRQCDLEGADLRGSSLKGVRMNHANLRDTNFDPLLFGAEGAHERFSPCHFEHSVLRYANFEGANLKSAIFLGADLSHANFRGCDLREADFTGAKLEDTIFDDANMKNTIFETPKKSAFSLDALSKRDD